MFARILLPFLCAAALPAQHSDTALKNPFQSPDDRARGGAFYRSQCANCHGIDGKGGASGPSLVAGTFRHASNDEGLFRVITKGVAGTSMPGFSMNGREIWQIVAYVRSMSIGRTGGATSGNAAAGKEIFAASKCLDCHWLNGEGAARGLDLSAIGTRLTPGELRTALIEPSAEVAPEYWQWRAVKKDSTELRGQRLNEDTFSVQILDAAGRLRSVDKAELKSQSLEQKSGMPSFQGKLSEGQLNDLVAFLATLKGDAR